jgi:site-specific recombinase XerD
LAQQIMRRHILPVARNLSITKRIGWHTFRHTYSTLLRSTGAELKIMHELLRHSTIRVTLDTYTQAVTTEKRNAQEAVVALLSQKKRKKRKPCPAKLDSVYLFCAFLCPRENRPFPLSS